MILFGASDASPHPSASIDRHFVWIPPAAPSALYGSARTHGGSLCKSLFGPDPNIPKPHEMW